MRLASLLLAAATFAAAPAASFAESCITQSAMQPAERDALLHAASSIAALAADTKTDAIRSQTMQQFQGAQFSGIENAVRTAAPHLNGASFVPGTVWLLDAADNKPGPDGTPQDAQFFCTLNKSSASVSYLIPALPPGRYGLVVLDTAGTNEPWQIAVLLRQSTPGANPGTWQLGGFFPRATTAGGHDGLWYWRAARDFSQKKQPWNAWVYFTEAESLLRPVTFVSSPHLDKLESERTAAAPAALSGGLGVSTPLVIATGRTTAGTPNPDAEIRVTALSAENAPDHSGAIDLLAHVQQETALADPIASRARNLAAAKAIVAAYPELRSAFHGIWIVADLPNNQTYISEEPMSSL